MAYKGNEIGDITQAEMAMIDHQQRVRGTKPRHPLVEEAEKALASRTQSWINDVKNRLAVQ